MSQFLAPQIVFLKDGTDTSQGLGQLSKLIYRSLQEPIFPFLLL